MSIVELSDLESGNSSVEPNSHRYRMVVVDDQQLVVDGLVEWVHLNAPDFDVVGTIGLWAEFHDNSWFPGDVVLMTAGDLRDDNDAIARVRLIRAAGAVVVVITTDGSAQCEKELLEAGAGAVVSRSQSAAELIGAARDALALTSSASTSSDGDPIVEPSEFDEAALAILRLYATGHSTVDISVSTGTKFELVRSTLQQIRTHYENQGRNAATRDDLVRRAAEDGFLTEL